ncbi:squalene/phytoene synthase family protein [Kordiimonas sp. SCSIO 12603]|uniref:squalene/phytoene synthase family protein n=1 Tax=Kordiimonas sp. SCSIO 12603 TaxID=2829596 RepID=UPI0021031A40|nr:squalene/phytoene synthase family protein [Kordiimonas sp. SCSIO 12603]UTW57390.1 squalene/phytoene synthase family protein [Kordiimonas sp. SCSIO 12603]
MNKDDRDRYLTTIFAPSSFQNQLWALWAFNQEVAKIRENVSEAMLGEIRLQWWTDAIDEVKSGAVREHPVCQALNEAGLSESVLDLLKETIAARKLDVFDDGPADFAALCDYADGVGGALQEASYRILAVDASVEAGINASRALGQAWTMLGLVRALPFHWQAGRSYMPASVKEGMHLPDPEQAFNQLKPTIDRMLNYTRQQLNDSKKVIKTLDKKQRKLFVPIALMELYLDTLKKADSNPFETPPFEASELKKLWKLFVFKTTV